MNNTNSNLKVIVGLGKTGLSCIRYLTPQGFDLAVIDSRLTPPGLQELQQNFPQVQTYLGGFDQDILRHIDELIISPGVSLLEPPIAACLRRGVRVISDIELFVNKTKNPIIAITGSNGKSTVTHLVGEMIKASGKKVGVGGNLGISALDLLKEETDFYVLELSSFQLETTNSLQAETAVVLNISSDHMDRYKNLTEYIATKQRIYTNCHVAVINVDDPLSYISAILPQKIVGFSSGYPKEGEFGVNNDYLMCGSEKLISINELKIKGLHNAINATAALALGTAINLPLPVMLTTLRNFPGLPHRCQWITKINDVDWYNDSKGTNVGATKAALEGLGATMRGKIVLIAGGIGKGADFSMLHNTVEQYVRTIVLIGRDASLIAKALAGTSKILHASSMADAVATCASEAISGDIVLLSPACASLDMFDNFEHRGEVFIAETKKITK